MLRPAVMRRPIAVTVDPSVYNDLRRRAIAADISLSHLCEVILSKAARKD
jgi:post-segregation antitoxin (ccd killing protein)